METIMIDVDDVIGDNIPYVKAYIEKHLGTLSFKSVDDITRYGTFPFEITTNFERWYDFLRSFDYEEYVMNMPVIDGAGECIRQLAHEYVVNLVTARPKKVEEFTIRWLRKNSIPCDAIFFEEQGLRNHGSILIDDSVENLELAVANGCRGILFNCPWNRYFDIAGKCWRAYSWKDVLYIVELLNGRKEFVR